MTVTGQHDDSSFSAEHICFIKYQKYYCEHNEILTQSVVHE